MAAGQYVPIQPVDPDVFLNGTLSFDEAASLTIKRGTPVVIDSAGRVDAAGTTPTSIFGIAAEDGHNGTASANKILVWPMRQGRLWRIALLEAWALTDLADVALGLVKDATTGFWYASTADGGAQAYAVSVVEGPAQTSMSVVGDTKALIYINILSSKFQATLA